MDFGRAEHALARLVIGRVEDVQQRHFERHIDFAAIERERKTGLHEADHRRHPEPAQHELRLEIAREGYVLPRQADLLLGLAQRGGERSLVARFDAPARKADLPGVILEVRGALREQHGESVLVIDQRHEHCRSRR